MMGKAAVIMSSMDKSLGRNFLDSKYTGKPMAPAKANPISCLFVRLRATLVFTLVKSLGTDT